MREQLYHATTGHNYEVIKEKGFNKIINFSTPLVINGKKRYQKNPGTLGFGLYGFDSKTIANFYGDEKIPDFKVYEFSIDVPDEQLLDLLSKIDRERYLLYKQKIDGYPIYREISKVYKNNGSQSSLEGALLEMYIKSVLSDKYKIEIKCIKGMTSTQIKGSNGSYLSNGCEYCIRCNSIILWEG